MSTAVAIMLLDDFDRGSWGLGTYPLVPGAAAAVEAIEACANNVAMDPVEWLSESYHLGLFDGVARPDDCPEEFKVSELDLECALE